MSLLEVRSASKNFGSLMAVRQVSLRVERGEMRAIIGPNGAGKTTFFNLITGFFPPTEGEIWFGGRDVTRLSAQRRVSLGMGRSFQVAEIFPELTVRENLRIAVEVGRGLALRPWLGRAKARLVRQAIDEVLAATGLTTKAARLAGELTHGDQRATEIAMVLALRPRLLLLDEPTAGMAEQETYDTVALIRRLHRMNRLTVILIEHDMRVVFHLADRITVLDRGRLLAEGLPDEIAANPAVQAAYLGEPA
ncbi:MAG: ABC transporter ATP-binding protein [Acetobacteraceae bacterium]|nr:ABC transporter ATP-binding protein [Acetobacteraceae bacterium]